MALKCYLFLASVKIEGDIVWLETLRQPVRPALWLGLGRPCDLRVCLACMGAFSDQLGVPCYELVWLMPSCG